MEGTYDIPNTNLYSWLLMNQIEWVFAEMQIISYIPKSYSGEFILMLKVRLYFLGTIGR